MSAEADARYPFRRISSTQQSNGKTSDLSAYYSDVTKMEHGDTNGLHKVDTIGSISLTPEQFERMYLGPQTQVKGDLRKTFGNPTPIGLAGLLLALHPITLNFMGWRGTGGAEGIPTAGFSIFLGGVVPTIAGIMEWVLGNSFPSLFLIIFGGFFLSYGVTLLPATNAYAPFSPNPNEPLLGAGSPEFAGSIGALALFMGLASTMMLIATLRTNLIFVLAFTCLTMAFYMLTVSRWYQVQGNMVNYLYYEKIAGGFGFGLCCFGWYLLLTEILTTVDFPVNLPVFDLSHIIPGASDLAKRKQKAQAESEPAV